MANPRFNKQTTNRRGAMGGGRMKKMGGGMTRKMYSKGSNGNGNGNGKAKNGKVPNKLKGFSRLPERVQMKINKKLAKKV